MIERFRDHAANERTYLAWMRTSIATMALAFLVERFDLFLAGQAGASAQSSGEAGRWIGIGLAVTAVVIVVIATLRFYRHHRAIRADETKPFGSSPETVVLGALAALMGVLLVAYFLTLAL